MKSRMYIESEYKDEVKRYVEFSYIQIKRLKTKNNSKPTVTLIRLDNMFCCLVILILLL